MITEDQYQDLTAVRADESLKKLFSLSKRPTLDLLNGLFGETFTPDNTEILPKNIEYVTADMSLIFADWALSVKEGDQSKQFHVEFQIADSATMIIRMFEYGFHIARDFARREDKKIVLRYPKQLVLYLERDDSIEEDIACVVEYPPYDEQSKFEYKVPVKKFWNIPVEELRESLYALIPFNAFSSREKMSKIDSSHTLTDDEKQQLMNQEFLEISKMVQSSFDFLVDTYRSDKITEDDLNKMGTVTVNLIQHLYGKFSKYRQTFVQEVERMVESVLDVKAMKEAKRQGRIEAKLESLFGILKAKNISDEYLISKIKNETNPDKLSNWIIAAATANSAAELKSALQND